MHDTTDRVEIIEQYIARGFSVVPIPAGKKGPVVKSWQKLRLKSANAFSADSNCGIILGEASGGLVVVDLDHAVAVELADRYLPPTDMIGGHGERTHWFYRVEGTMKKRAYSTTDKTLLIELLADGQQVVAGPSVHENGEIYSNLVGEPATLTQEALLEALDRLHIACKDRLGVGNLSHMTIDTAKAPSTLDDLHATLLRIGATVLSDGLTANGTAGFCVVCPGEHLHTQRNGPKDCLVWIGSAGGFQAKCVHSSCGVDSWHAFKQSHGMPAHRIMPITVEDSEDLKPETREKPPEFPADCLDPGGTLSRIINQNLSTAMYPMPELALAGALALMSLITGRKVQDRRELRTNGYYLGLASAGSGKNFARQLNSKIMTTLGADEYIGPSKLKSSAGLVNALVAQPSCLFQLDEISRLLHTMKNPKEAPHLYDIGSVMLEAYGEANTVWKPGAYADSKKNPIIDQPHLVVYGTAVPEEFWGSITVSNLTDGLLGRMMVFEFTGKTTLTESEIQPLCPLMLFEVEQWLNYEPSSGGNLKNYSPTPTIIQHTEEAWSRYWDHTKMIVNGKPNESEVVKGIWRRTAEKTGKLAILSACSRICPRDNAFPTIELSDVQWAIKLSNWLTRRLLGQAGIYVAENQHQDNLNRILRILRDWTSAAEIGHKVRWMKARDRNELISAAIVDGLIETRVIETGGRPRNEWRSLESSRSLI